MGSSKALDLPLSKIIFKTSFKIIFKKTSGSFKPLSTSRFDPYSWSKSNAKAAKHPKYSFNNSFKSLDSSYSSRCTSSRSGSLIPTRLFKGEPFHGFSNLVVLILIDVLLLCFSTLKLMHRPFDKERHDLHAFIFKISIFTKYSNVLQTSSSRNILLQPSHPQTFYRSWSTTSTVWNV